MGCSSYFRHLRSRELEDCGPNLPIYIYNPIRNHRGFRGLEQGEDWPAGHNTSRASTTAHNDINFVWNRHTEWSFRMIMGLSFLSMFKSSIVNVFIFSKAVGSSPILTPHTPHISPSKGIGNLSCLWRFTSPSNDYRRCLLDPSVLSRRTISYYPPV